MWRKQQETQELVQAAAAAALVPSYSSSSIGTQLQQPQQLEPKWLRMILPNVANAAEK